ncbi:MAG TPA: hypothetical protein VE825_08670 [Terriglobales bacterium]|nr:hypothetical protein [Terriglobales bacterium]
MRPFFFGLCVLLALALAAAAQQMPPMPAAPPKQQQQTPPTQQEPSIGSQPMPDVMMPRLAAPLKFASGTAWLPQSTPENMWMLRHGGWSFMIHGNLVAGYNQQGGPRGAGKAQAMDFAMFMEQHKLGRGTIEFREMLSAEPLTAPHPGFPELFQTGETYHGQPLVDHQHPHDVFGEVSLLFSVPIREKVSWFFYGAPAGEPALGPVAFLHRYSAADIPAAPLGHHVQDSTHISFGVVTSGFVLGPVKLEGSLFNGREPDEARYNFDFAPMSSWSVRAAARPGKNWEAQYSFGHLVRPEATEPTDIDRQTASVSYNRPIARGNWATSLIWGRNRKLQSRTTQNSYLLESELNFLDKDYGLTRLELVDKDELFPALPPPEPSFRIGAYTFGGVRDLVHDSKLQLGLGAAVTFYSKPSSLNAAYGDNPVSFQIFLRVRPGSMKMGN